MTGPDHPAPTAWCGNCDPRTRLRGYGPLDPGPVTRCPTCHPLRAATTPTVPQQRPSAEPSRGAGYAAARAVIDRIRSHRRPERTR